MKKTGNFKVVLRHFYIIKTSLIVKKNRLELCSVYFKKYIDDNILLALLLKGARFNITSFALNSSYPILSILFVFPIKKHESQHGFIHILHIVSL